MRPLPGDDLPQPYHRGGESLPAAQRLWAKVNGPWYGGVGQSDCWLWFGAAETGPWRVLPDGPRVKRLKRFRYGRIHVQGRGLVGTHRLAYELMIGPVPDGQVVAHSCDRPLCCNPQHLVAKTQADNVAEMYSKGRARCATTGPLPEEQRWAS